MGTSFVTLGDLPGTDPAAADNSASSGGTSGATGTPGASPPAGADLHAKVAELEQLVQRHRQQLTGSQEEVQRLRTEMQALRQQSSSPASAPTTTATLPAARVKLSEAVRKLELEDDPSLLESWEQQVTTSAPAVNEEQVRQWVQQAQGQTSTRDTLQRALTQRHSELISDPQFTAAVGERYQALKQDPLSQSLYPDDPQFVVEEPTTGLKYDMRILYQAANEVKATRPATRPATPTLGLANGSGGAPPAASGPMIPKQFVDQGGILSDPRVQVALRNMGWGANTRAQAQALLKHLSPQAQARWARGEV